MVTLNLPPFTCHIRHRHGKAYIFDLQRKKYVKLTPEEWVRQHFVHYLITNLHYPKGLIGVERSMHYNTLKKRVDILVYNRQGYPWMIVECKNPEVFIDNTVIKQLLIYYKVLKPNYIVVTNGMKHWCAAVCAPKGLSICPLPPFPDNMYARNR